MLGRGATLRLLRYSTQVPKAALVDGTDALEECLRSNELLKNLRSKYHNKQFQVVEDGEEGSQHLNCDISLPMTVFPKKEIFNKVMSDDKISSWRKPLTQWFRLGVQMMKYYRDGLRDTYRVAKSTRNLVEKTELDPKTALVTQLCKLIEFNEIATRMKKDVTALPLTRKQFVMYHRRAQVWKLPAFFLLALIFEEFTVVVCYVFPKLAPHNCLTPGAYQKVCRTHTNDLPSWKPMKYQSPYTISKSSLFHILRCTPVAHIPKWKLKIYDSMDIRKNPSERLMRIHQYLFIDDWFLLKDIMGADPTLLSRKELVNCIFERQLFSADEDLNKMVNEEDGRRLLIWRLFAYWSFRFDGTVTVGGDQLFAEKWGVNNVSILNYSGLVGNKQLDTRNLSVLEK